MSEICPKCGLPKEICVCQDIARVEQVVNIKVDKRRYGKKVTIISGLDDNIDIDDLAKTLKAKCATGGTVKKGGIVELQGNHMKKVRDVLAEIGYQVNNR